MIKDKFIPFYGSKARYYNLIKNIVISGLPYEFKTIIDIFGGSGALSLMFHDFYPTAKIIFNDYDRIIEDDKGVNLIDKTIKKYNTLRNEIYDDMIKYKIKKDEKIPKHLIKKYIHKYQKLLDKDKYLSYLVASNLSFNGRHEHINIKDSYNKLRETDITLKHTSYNDIFDDLVKHKPKYKTLLLIDPPYLNTDWNKYNVDYFNFWEYIKLLKYVLTCINLGYYVVMFEK